MKTALRTIVIIIFVVLMGAQSAIAESKWINEKNEDEIDLYYRKLPSSDFFQTKGTTIIQAPITVIVEVLKDNKSLPEWMTDLKGTRILETIDEKSRKLYNILDFPWPVNDRDVIIISRSTVDSNKGKIVINSESINDSTIPISKDYVRIKSIKQQFLFEYFSDNETRVTYMVHLEPGGDLSASMVNSSIKKSPLKALLGLKKMVKKEKYWKNSSLSKDSRI